MSPKYLTLLPFDFNPKLLGRMAEAILCLARRLTVLTIIHCSRFYDIRTSRITTFPTLRPRSTYLPTNDEDEHNDERRCLRQKRRRGGRGEKWYDAKKSSSVVFDALLIVCWILTMKHHETRPADPPFDPRSLPETRILECDMFSEPEFDFPSNELIIKKQWKYF